MKKVLIRLTVAMALLAAFALYVSAQFPMPERKPPPPPSPAPASQNEAPISPCPNLDVRAPTPKYVRDGAPITFEASLSGGD